jgi:formylglycine-generating enzyme required for sulfatase activity
VQPSYWWQLLYELFKWKPAGQPPFRRSVAFLAGVSHYNHITPQLDFVRSDLTDFRNFLLTEGGFDTVYEVRDGNVSREVFDAFMKGYFSDPRGPVTPEDRLLVYYSGHGGAQANVEPYLLFEDANPGVYTKDVLDVKDVYGWANTIAAKHLLIILDSCFSGLARDKPGPEDVTSALSNALAGEPSGLLLTAGTGDERAYALRYSKDKNGSIFTHALIDAMKSMSQSEGIITIGEAFERAKVSVANFDAVENKKMTPLATPLLRQGSIGKGNFIFVNPKAQNPTLPFGLNGGGSAIAKAPDAVDPNLSLIQLEYDAVKNSDNLAALRAFDSTYKGKPFGQTLVYLIEEKISRLERPAPVAPPISTPVTERQPHPADTKVNPKDGQLYAWIPPGEFQMGCSDGDTECNNDEKPPVGVRITRGFWLGQTEVTQAAYAKVMNSNPSRFKAPDRPVDSVAWDEARQYCVAVGGRLPTEAEWEYAARAGNKQSRYGNVSSIAWYDSISGKQTHPVGQKDKNAWGLSDMLGNVWEWVADWWQKDYYTTLSSPAIDPKGPGTGVSRVVRGGSWYYASTSARASYRYLSFPAARHSGLGDGDFGFRCAWEATAP